MVEGSFKHTLRLCIIVKLFYLIVLIAPKCKHGEYIAQGIVIIIEYLIKEEALEKECQQ